MVGIVGTWNGWLRVVTVVIVGGGGCGTPDGGGDPRGSSSEGSEDSGDTDGTTTGAAMPGSTNSPPGDTTVDPPAGSETAESDVTDGTTTAVDPSDSDSSTDASDEDSTSSTGTPPLPPDSDGVGTDETPPGFVWVRLNGNPSITLLKFDAELELLATYVFEVNPSGQDYFGSGHVSVAASGDALMTTNANISSVPNRLVVIDGDVSKCADINGIPGIQTSTGPALADGDDECIRWERNDIEGLDAAYWTRGVWDEAEQSFGDVEIWTVEEGVLDPDSVSLLDAETGVTIGTTELESNNALGAGSAVDGNGDLWGMRHDDLVRISHDTLEESMWTTPFIYLLAGENLSFDLEGLVYFARNEYRFVPDSEVFEELTVVSDDVVRAGVLHEQGGDHLTLLSTGTIQRLAADLSSVDAEVELNIGAFSNSTGAALLNDGQIIITHGFSLRRCDLADETCISGELPPVPPGSIFNGSMVDHTGYANWLAGPQ